MPADVPLSKDEMQQRGLRMQALLNDPLMQEAFQAIEANVFAKWMRTPSDQAFVREELYFLVKTVELLKAEMQRVVAQGTASSLPKPADVV